MSYDTVAYINKQENQLKFYVPQYLKWLQGAFE